MWWPFVALSLLIGLIVVIIVLYSSGSESDPAMVELSSTVVVEETYEPVLIRKFREEYIAANGGREAIERLISIRVTGEFESGGQVLPFRTLKRRPDQSITTLHFSDYELSFIVSGDLVWQRVEQPGLEPQDTLKEGAEADAMREMGHFFDALMYTVLYESEAILSVELGVMGELPCYIVEFKSETRGMHAVVHIDQEALTPVLRTERFADGKIREVRYADYRKIYEGMLEPFLVETLMDGELQSRVVLEKAQANIGILKQIFEMPEG